MHRGVRLNRRVIIAAGHYPDAPGAQYPPLSEHAEAVKAVSKLFLNLLERGFEPVIARGKLSEKASIANRLNPLCAIDVHFNASSNPTANGTETLFGSNPQDKKLARHIQSALVRKLNLRDRGIKFADYAGTAEWDECFFTREINCPAAIIEPLFISNPGEAQLLMGVYPIHGFIAEAIGEGVEKFAKSQQEANSSGVT